MNNRVPVIRTRVRSSYRSRYQAVGALLSACHMITQLPKDSRQGHLLVDRYILATGIEHHIQTHLQRIQFHETQSYSLSFHCCWSQARCNSSAPEAVPSSQIASARSSGLWSAMHKWAMERSPVEDFETLALSIPLEVSEHFVLGNACLSGSSPIGFRSITAGLDSVVNFWLRKWFHRCPGRGFVVQVRGEQPMFTSGDVSGQPHSARFRPIKMLCLDHVTKRGAAPYERGNRFLCRSQAFSVSGPDPVENVALWIQFRRAILPGPEVIPRLEVSPRKKQTVACHHRTV